MHTPLLIADLRRQLQSLTVEAQSISPAIYDTAMVLRFAPPSPFWPAFSWLVEQQAEDGGWCDAGADDRARTVPTLAAVLALYEHQERQSVRAALHAGVAWLQRTAHTWEGPLPDDLPVGVELLLPALLADASHTTLSLPQAPFAELLGLGARRRAKLATMPPQLRAQTTATHSWESWGVEADPGLISAERGVGCSPAATAAWCRASHDEQAQRLAHAYLQRATAATGTGIAGVVPTAFPIGRFEQAYSLHTLAQAGLITHPYLADLVQPLLDSLAAAIGVDGIGCADGFVADGDDTAAALGALLAAGRSVDLAPLYRFAAGDHFASYRGELQPSVITTARATQVALAGGDDVTRFRQWIVRRQQPDGRWLADKWNGLWLYTTWQAILALRDDPASLDALQLAQMALRNYQRADGGWGVRESTSEATAYAVLALTAFSPALPVHRDATLRGYHFLCANYRPLVPMAERHWLAKERYTPFRLSHIIMLAAMTVAEQLL